MLDKIHLRFIVLFLLFFFTAGVSFAQETEKQESFVGDSIFSLDLGYMGTGIKNNGWGAGIRWEKELFRFFSIRPGFSHMSLFPLDLDYNIITVGIELEALFYPFGRGLDRLYLGIAQGCEFLMYPGKADDQNDSAIYILPEIGWKQNFLNYVMLDVFINYRIYLNSDDINPAVMNNVLDTGFQYGAKIRINLKKLFSLWR